MIRTCVISVFSLAEQGNHLGGGCASCNPNNSALCIPAASPLSALGLKSRFGEDEDKERDNNGVGGIELNRRGLPARKRKKNSLIFGDDDLVSIPVRLIGCPFIYRVTSPV